MWVNSRTVGQHLRTRWRGPSTEDLSPPVRRLCLESLEVAEPIRDDPLVNSPSQLSKTPADLSNLKLSGIVLSSERDDVDDKPEGSKDFFLSPSPPNAPSVAREVIFVDENSNIGAGEKESPKTSQGLAGGDGGKDKEANSGLPCSGQSRSTAVLSEEQQRVFDTAVRRRRSVLLTGGAGTGKSHLLRAIVSALPRRSTFVTATTGLAALNLGGITVHSFAGCGIIDPINDTPSAVYNRLTNRAIAVWRQCRILVIDEISMMDAWFFDVLEYLARKVRNNPSPFGGIQLILSGDFLQLPPVVQNRDPNSPLFCFEAESWCRVNTSICVLSQSFRQKNAIFFSLLNELRRGVLSNSSIATLTSLSVSTRVLRLDDSIKSESGEGARLVDDRGFTKGERHKGYTILRAKREEVKRVNDERFAELKTPVFSYHVFHSSEFVKKVNKDLENVKLRVGCRVILTKNIDVSGGLVNGSTGTIVKFVDASKLKDFSESPGAHDLRHIAHEEHDLPHHHLPVVQFDTFNGGSVEEKGPSFFIEPQRWSVRVGDKEMGYSAQIPLQLAYAITIHKSQGMSLGRTNVDFHTIFADGQAYVALSRCTSIENLVIENFNIGCITPNPRALAFYKALERRKKMRAFPLCSDKKDVDDYDDDDDEEDAVSTNPWGGGDVSGESFGDTGEGGAGSELFEADGVGAPHNVTKAIDVIRQELTGMYSSWSSVRSRVLSRTHSVHNVRSSSLVMDETSLLALAALADSVTVYRTIFIKNENTMRVPRVVCEAFRRGIALSETPAASSPAMDSRSSHSEAAAAVQALLSRARDDFVLDEQREVETRPLPKALSSWDDVPTLLDVAAENGTKENGDWNQILQFSQYLHELKKPNVYQWTESLELAAVALSLDMQVCSFSYLKNDTSCRRV